MKKNVFAFRGVQLDLARQVERLDYIRSFVDFIEKMFFKLAATIFITAIVSICSTASETTPATTQAPADKEMNLVPLEQRVASFRNHGRSVTVPVEPNKTYFIFAKIKLTTQSSDPNPRLRFAIRFQEKSGRFNYKWCEYQSLGTDAFSVFATTYTASKFVNEITVIFNPQFSDEVRAYYRDFVIMELKEEYLL